MKRRITKEDLVVFLRELDTRVSEKDDSWIDRAINNGFAELATVTNQFSNEEYVELTEYYELGEDVFTVNLKQVATSVYDTYLMCTGQDPAVYDHGEQKFRNKNLIYQDPQNVNSIKVNLKDATLFNNITYDAAVIKYFYIPTANFDEIYVTSDVYLALEQAFAASAYDMLHDVEKASQKRSAMQRTGYSIVDTYPTDFSDPGRASLFPSGV